VKASSVKLNAIKLASQEVSKLGECTFECINNKECYSVNFGGILGGKYSCELLGTDRFSESSKLVASEEFDHYYIKVRNIVCYIIFIYLYYCTLSLKFEKRR